MQREQYESTQSESLSCEELCEIYCPEVYDHYDTNQLSFLEACIA